MAARFRMEDLVLEERLKNVTGAEGTDRGVSDVERGLIVGRGRGGGGDRWIDWVVDVPFRVTW